jgi:hypothetical protein
MLRVVVVVAERGVAGLEWDRARPALRSLSVSGPE